MPWACSSHSKFTVPTPAQMAIRAASRTFDGLVSFLDVKAGPLFGSFCVGETRLGRGKGVVATRVVGLSS